MTLIRQIYALTESPFYAKIGISKDEQKRRRVINRATKRPVRKLVSLPFIFPLAWEEVMLSLWPKWTRRAPAGSGIGAGRSEWRWLPFPFLTPALCAAMVCAAFILQIYIAANLGAMAAGYSVPLPIAYPAQGWLWLFGGANLVDAMRWKTDQRWFSAAMAVLAAGVVVYLSMKPM